MTVPLVPWAARKGVRFFADHPWIMVLCIIVYVILPIDILPEAFLGPLGYVDDLVVVMLPLLLREYARKIKTEEPSARR